jgi:NADH:ubiquinone oxidoreductase subunit K
MTSIDHLLFTGAILFAIGLTIILTRRNAIMILLGIELLLNASNLNLVAFEKLYHNLSGQLFALFVIVIAVCETSVGLAIVLRAYRFYRQVSPNEISNIKE